MEKNYTVIILGGTGIIGRELSRHLIAKGMAVYAVSRGRSRVSEGACPVIADVYNEASLREAIGDLEFDVVIDLVSFNVSQLYNILAVFEGRYKQYMFVSSATVYAEPQTGEITEKTPFIKGGWSYPISKIACEKALMDYFRGRSSVYTIVRPYITYSEQRLAFGIWEMEDVLDRIVNEAPLIIGNEVASAQTTVTHAHDLGAGMAALIGNEKAYNEDFHITSDEHVTWREVYAFAAKATGRRLRVVECASNDIIRRFPELKGKIADRSMRRVFDNSKLYAACPDLAMQYRVADGYRGIITQAVARRKGLLGYSNEGGVDKLVLKNARSNTDIVLLEQYRNQRWSGMELKGQLAYLIGCYIPQLIKAVRLLRRLFIRNSNYGV